LEEKQAVVFIAYKVYIASIFCYTSFMYGQSLYHQTIPLRSHAAQMVKQHKENFDSVRISSLCDGKVTILYDSRLFSCR